jgi:hypothetical protein
MVDCCRCMTPTVRSSCLPQPQADRPHTTADTSSGRYTILKDGCIVRTGLWPGPAPQQRLAP